MTRDWYKYFWRAVSTLTEAAKYLIPASLYRFYIELTLYKSSSTLADIFTLRYIYAHFEFKA